MERNSSKELCVQTAIFSYLTAPLRLFFHAELSSMGTSFTYHISERVSKAITSSTSIHSPHRLSISTALALFNLKIAPIATYGIRAVWEDLTVANLRELEKTKSMFVKRVLSVSRTARTRLAYQLAGCEYLIQDIIRTFRLPITPAASTYLDEVAVKLAAIPSDFYHTTAMSHSGWMDPLQDNRHLQTRYAIHGFHHQMCSRSGCFESTVTCVCRFSGDRCYTYHLHMCRDAPPLSRLASEERLIYSVHHILCLMIILSAT